ncbi:hypothetical protein [Streptomyces sp. NPDC006668]
MNIVGYLVSILEAAGSDKVRPSAKELEQLQLLEERSAKSEAEAANVESK